MAPSLPAKAAPDAEAVRAQAHTSLDAVVDTLAQQFPSPTYADLHAALRSHIATCHMFVDTITDCVPYIEDLSNRR